MSLLKSGATKDVFLTAVSSYIRPLNHASINGTNFVLCDLTSLRSRFFFQEAGMEGEVPRYVTERLTFSFLDRFLYQEINIRHHESFWSYCDWETRRNNNNGGQSRSASSTQLPITIFHLNYLAKSPIEDGYILPFFGGVS